MDAAEYDRVAGPALRSELTELVAIAPEVCVTDHVVLLIVVSQNQERIAELATSRRGSARLIRSANRPGRVRTPRETRQCRALQESSCSWQDQVNSLRFWILGGEGIVHRAGREPAGHAHLTLVLGPSFARVGSIPSPALRRPGGKLYVPALDFLRIIQIGQAARSLPRFAIGLSPSQSPKKELGDSRIG